MNYEIQVEIEDPDSMSIDIDDLEQAVAAALQLLGCEDASLTVVITDDESVRHLNQQYRGVDAPTDILSFSAQEDDSLVDLPPEMQEEMGNYLGDLIIAYPFTVAQAARYGNPLDAELRLLVVHGTLHLSGYDHDTDERQADMWDMQGRILRSLGDTSTNWEREYEA